MRRCTALTLVGCAVVLASITILPVRVLGAVVQTASTHSAVAQFDNYAEQSRRAWAIPGMAVALVKDGKIVEVRGFGVRELGRGEPVDGNTVFAIASITKSFTAAVLAILVDRHRLAWNDPVRKFLPQFELYDPEVTNAATVRDFVAQRTCLGDKDLLTWDSPYSQPEVLRRMRYLRPACGFRDRFQYNNLNFVVAGAVAAAASGRPWADLVESEIFAPLGMTRSTARTSVAARRHNLATPYIRMDGKLRALPLFDEGPAEAAGAIHSTAADMAKWLLVQMGNGSLDGTRLWSEEQGREMHEPQMVIGDSPERTAEMPASEFLSYGLGWFVSSVFTHQVIEHDGQSDGMHAIISMMPGVRLGIVVLTNTSQFGLPEALAYRWYELNLGLPLRDWSSIMMGKLADENSSIDLKAVTERAPHVFGTRPSLPLRSYTGNYHEDLLGDARVTLDSKGGLHLFLLDRTARLEHWHFDTFHPDWGGDIFMSLSVPFITFALDMNGNVRGFRTNEGDKFQITDASEVRKQ